MRPRTTKTLFALRHVDIALASQVDDARYERFQLHFLDNMSRFGIDVKSRQIAWSFTAALDAVIDGILTPNTPHLFVSINLDEAREKIRYARNIIEAIRPDMRPSLVRDSQTELEFANGSRLISHPCRPARGKARARVYLDEMAHYQRNLDKEIYRAALPSTTKGDGYLRIGSSPLGASGLFWEIATESLRPYPGYAAHRIITPWWAVYGLCSNVDQARRVAPEMSTEERVRTFGATALVEIFENMFIEDFQQEYECAWLDESTSWISWAVIQKNQLSPPQYWRAKNTGEIAGVANQIAAAIKSGSIEQHLVGGVDIGRTHDKTEIMLLGQSTTEQMPIRLMATLDNTPFDAQESAIRQLINALPITRMLIDQNGIGMQLAENLARTGIAKGVTFTNKSKEDWAREARIQAERGLTPLPVDRDLAYQIHSIKKIVTPSKNNVFDTERNDEHHADKFWAWALALWANRESGRPAVMIGFI